MTLKVPSSPFSRMILVQKINIEWRQNFALIKRSKMPPPVDSPAKTIRMRSRFSALSGTKPFTSPEPTILLACGRDRVGWSSTGVSTGVTVICARDMCIPAHISLVICVSPVGIHKTLIRAWAFNEQTGDSFARFQRALYRVGETRNEFAPSGAD